MIDQAAELKEDRSNRVLSALALECVVGSDRFLVAADDVAQLLELEHAQPLPLAKSYVAGLGVHDGHVVICLELSARAPGADAGLRPGVLLRTSAGVPLVLCVDAIGTFTEYRRSEGAEDRTKIANGWPSWIRVAALQTGQAIGLLDVNRLIAELWQSE